MASGFVFKLAFPILSLFMGLVVERAPVVHEAAAVEEVRVHEDVREDVEAELPEEDGAEAEAVKE